LTFFLTTPVNISLPVVLLLTFFCYETLLKRDIQIDEKLALGVLRTEKPQGTLH